MLDTYQIKALAALEPKDVSTIINGLRVAAERFDENAIVSQTEADRLKSPAYLRIVAQFEKQAKDSRKIADQLSEAFGL